MPALMWQHMYVSSIIAMISTYFLPDNCSAPRDDTDSRRLADSKRTRCCSFSLSRSLLLSSAVVIIYFRPAAIYCGPRVHKKKYSTYFSSDQGVDGDDGDPGRVGTWILALLLATLVALLTVCSWRCLECVGRANDRAIIAQPNSKHMASSVITSLMKVYRAALIFGFSRVVGCCDGARRALGRLGGGGGSACAVCPELDIRVRLRMCVVLAWKKNVPAVVGNMKVDGGRSSCRKRLTMKERQNIRSYS